MPIPIKIPDLGTTVDEVEIVSWLVEEGQAVRRGDLLVEIETDKATSELESVAEGVLLRQMVPAGATVETGEVLAYVGEPGESVPQPSTEEQPKTPVPARRDPCRAGSQARVSYVVRNLARKLGVDLASVEGTGQGGAITRADVLQASRLAPGVTSSVGESLPRLQSAVAKAVTTSAREIPHLRITAAIDMTAVQELRERHAEAGTKISYDAIFLKAMAGALRSVPLLAAHLENGRVVRPDGLHLALAVGVENDLFLPVIKDVDEKTLDAIQSEISTLTASAKAGKLRLEQLTGGCMALSNLGMYPIESFDPIIFPEHSSILAVGAVQRRIVVIDERMVIRPVAMANLAVDHRLVNGRTAAEFLTKLKEIVETGVASLSSQSECTSYGTQS